MSSHISLKIDTQTNKRLRNSNIHTMKKSAILYDTIDY